MARWYERDRGLKSFVGKEFVFCVLRPIEHRLYVICTWLHHFKSNQLSVPWTTSSVFRPAEGAPSIFCTNQISSHSMYSSYSIFYPLSVSLFSPSACSRVEFSPCFLARSLLVKWLLLAEVTLSITWVFSTPVGLRRGIWVYACMERAYFYIFYIFHL